MDKRGSECWVDVNATAIRVDEGGVEDATGFYRCKTLSSLEGCATGSTVLRRSLLSLRFGELCDNRRPRSRGTGSYLRDRSRAV